MGVDLSTLAWTSAGELVEALARHAGLPMRTAEAFRTDTAVEDACARLGLEGENVDLAGDQVRGQLRNASPAVLLLAGSYLGLAACRKHSVLLLAPNLSLRRIPLETLRDAVCAEAEAAHTGEVAQLLRVCSTPASRRGRARRVLLEEQIRSHRVGRLWQLRAPPGSSFIRQVWDAGLATHFLMLCGSHAGEYALWLISWWTLGVSLLAGRFDRGLLIAWCLLLASIVPLRMLASRSMGLLGLGIGGLLKQRLLAGALRLETEETRSQGAGHLLGRVIESETMESLALSGGLTAVMALFEVGLSAAVLALGSVGVFHVLALAGWIAVSGVLWRRYLRERSQWSNQRLQMTNDLVERMAGHRTRLVQAGPEQWHAEEDEALDRYLAASAAMDRKSVWLAALIPRGWLILGVAGLAPSFLTVGSVDTAPTAIGLGGVLLTYQALKRLAGGLASLAGAVICWREVAPLFHAAARTEPIGAAITPKSDVILQAQDLQFRYGERAEPTLRGASFRISKGDWILLEGGSGGGKSTLASVLAGLREPAAGLLLAGGLDRQTLGAREWRKRAAMAPQYHENHILTETLAFNLLMGRRWPPRENDLLEAGAVCRELGLGELLDRMPSGLQQMVGESGWQLSQGEKSRVFLARALLQQADLTILDESLAALDPESLRQCLECVLERARTLLLVAHP